MNEQQRRAWAALELGPRWRLTRAAAGPAAGEVSSLQAVCAWGSGTGACPLTPVGPVPAPWLVIMGAATQPSPAGLDPDAPTHLLEHILAAVGLEAGREVSLLHLPTDTTHRAAVAHAPPAACVACLHGHIQRAAPCVLVLLGHAAAQAVWGEAVPWAGLRGQVHALAIGDASVATVVTHHPADLLNQPADKAQAWADWCLARRAQASG